MQHKELCFGSLVTLQRLLIYCMNIEPCVARRPVPVYAPPRRREDTYSEDVISREPHRAQQLHVMLQSTVYTSRRVNSQREEGRGSSRRLPPSCNVLRFDRLPSSVGTVPDKKFNSRSNRWRLAMPPMAEGIVPVKPFWNIMNTCKFVMKSRFGGSGPAIPGRLASSIRLRKH